MNKSKLKVSIALMAAITAFSFMAGCGKKAPEPAMTHHESGSAVLIATEIYDECVANKDYQGAEDALETLEYLIAFYSGVVYYEDVKNKDFNNIEYKVLVYLKNKFK